METTIRETAIESVNSLSCHPSHYDKNNHCHICHVSVFVVKLIGSVTPPSLPVAVTHWGEPVSGMPEPVVTSVAEEMDLIGHTLLIFPDYYLCQFTSFIL